MASKINKNIFDESKIIKKDSNISKPIEEINIPKKVEEEKILDISVEKNAIKNSKIANKNLNDKSKEYLNIVENEEKKVKKIVKKENVKVNIDNNEQLLIVQEAQLMLESVKKNIIKTKIEIQIYKELYQSEHQRDEKELYESKLKLFGRDLIYFEKRKNIIETIINTEISKR